MIHDEFRKRADRRTAIVADILKTDHGLPTQRNAIDILNLQLPENYILLITRNASFQDYLGRKVYEIIKAECEKLDYLVE